MLRGPRLGILVAGLAAAVFIAWPGFTVDRDSEWRPVLAGFQLQKETGSFIGAKSALVHFHGLDGRPGRVRFALAPRVDGDRAEVSITTPGGARSAQLSGGRPVEVEVPFGATADLELKLDTVAATNPRPILLSGLRIEREAGLANGVLALLPLVLGGLALALLASRPRTTSVTVEGNPTVIANEPTLWERMKHSHKRSLRSIPRLRVTRDDEEPGNRPSSRGFLSWEASTRGAVLFAVLVVVASTWLVVSAFDPVRASSFAAGLREFAPMTLALAFAGAGLAVPGVASTALALAGVTLSLHLDTVHSGFVYDDRLWARPWTLPEVASTFAGSEDPRGISGQQYRPIPSVTHALDHALWGPSSFAFHGTNLALHALSAFLLHSLLLRLRVPRAAAVLGALALTVHPMAASSLGWISERTDTLTDIFMLTTLLVFLGPKGTQVRRVLGVALLALWSKETAVMLPVLIVLVAFVGLSAEERRARFATMRSLFAFVVLFVAVWVSLFPEKTVDRLMASAGAPSHENGLVVLFGNLFGQLFHPIGFEVWRATQATASVWPWFAVAVIVGLGSLAASFADRARSLPWRLVSLGIAFSALVVIPFRGHDAVDVYRLGHTPVLGFGILVAGLSMLVLSESLWRALAFALTLLLRFGPVSSETSTAWGYPGFQFRMALRFNLENPYFMNGLTPEMRRDLERESRFEAHRDNPLSAPFEP